MEFTDDNEYYVYLTFEHGGRVVDSMYAVDDFDATSQFDDMYMRMYATGRIHAGEDVLERFDIPNPVYHGVVLMQLVAGDARVLHELEVNREWLITN